MAKKKDFANDAPERVKEVFRCAHDLCDKPAICSLILKTGRANMCRFHYDQRFKIEAEKNNRERGLTSVEQMQAFCRELTGKRKAPGNWWAREVIDGLNSGHLYSYAAVELARNALRNEVRIPGEDDE